MILASHIILSAYGFWLPNDPRGSWSDFVGAWELLRYGRATKVRTRRSVARVPHDRWLRMTAKRALKHPAVRFSGVQARSIAEGFGRACFEGRYGVLACAILPDHAHLVVAHHARHISKIVAHLKSRATQRLRELGIHPFDEGSTTSMWARRYWKVFIDNDRHLHSAIRYVHDNPLKEGKRLQNWSFVAAQPDAPRKRGG